jgi:parvulin-like peptidyl-prolyl isomerase
MKTVKPILVLIVIPLGVISLYLAIRRPSVTVAPGLVASKTDVPQSPATRAEVSQTASVVVPSKKIDARIVQQSPGPTPADAVAVVNGVAITASDLDQELTNLLISPTAHGALKQEQKDAPLKAALEELIVRQLAYQHAQRIGLRVTTSEIAATVKKIKRRYQTEKQFREALKVEEISEQEFERRIEKDLMLRKIAKIELEEKSRVSDSESRAYYEQNKRKFVVPESIRLFRIVIKIVPGKEDEAKQNIDEIYSKLRAGADFGETAYKSSEDDYRVKSGDYGTIHRGQLPAELEAKAFAVKPGEISSPFKTSDGWQVIRVENKQAQRQLRYREVREKIKSGLREQRQRQRRLDFIASLKAEAKIEYLNR